MKRLTMNQVAKASLKANKKAYRSLAVGIFLAVYLCTAAVLGAYGTIQANQQKIIDRVGYIDGFFLNSASVSDETVRSSGWFARVGKVFVTAQIDKTGQYVGYYDEEALSLMPRTCVEGRMPENPGEIALEETALAQLRLDIGVGDQVTWTMQPLAGLPEERTYTLVGVLNDQSPYMESYGSMISDHGTPEWPNALVYSQDTPFQTGDPAVHRVVTYATLVTYSRFTNSDAYEAWGYNFIAISRSTGQATWYDPALEDLEKYAGQSMIWWIMGGALLLTCGIGISSAMESMLAQKTEEIGMLRAVGATRRQIRRLFGRDGWLLCLIALPIGIGLGIVTVWVISLFAERTILFRLNGWLLLPVAALSALCVLLSSRLPLKRASRQTPMGVLRDTGTLRKAKRFQSKKQFRATRLIASRQTRLHPLRQAGASVMVALTLLLTAVLSEAFLYQSGYQPAYDFYIQPVNVHYTTVTSGSLHFAGQAAKENVLTEQDMQQIRAIENVQSVTLETAADILLELNENEVPQYFRDYYTEERLIAGMSINDESALHYTFHNPVMPFIFTNSLAYLLEDTPDQVTDLTDEYRVWNAKTFQEMQAAQRAYGVTGKLIPLTVEVVDVNDPEFQRGVVDGKINLAALDAGQEVLVYAPTLGYWETVEHGETVGNTAGADFGEYRPDAQLKGMAVNDYFRAGQSLSLLQALTEPDNRPTDFSTGPYTPAELENMEQAYRNLHTDKTAVTVGAVLESAPLGSNGLCLMTTEKGLRALGFAPTQPTFVNITLTGEVDRAAEEAIQRRLETIASRAGMEVVNRMANARENARQQRKTELVFLGVIILFFAVAVSMQVSSAGRRIRADQRMIGTLRAVGADESALLGCYRLPMIVTTAIGLLLALCLFILMGTVWSNYFLMGRHAVITLPLMILLAALCALCCMIGVKARLRQVLNRSVVENIREL
ncbi:MAG: ABC transporter permease [Clostridia bacterium]|nr:ABC transporter permease [Clostridia bacterium]